jgi:hypothetical protein
MFVDFLIWFNDLGHKPIPFFWIAISFLRTIPGNLSCGLYAGDLPEKEGFQAVQASFP